MGLRLLVFAGLLLLALGRVQADGGDLVTMRNGDIFNGTVARESFSFDTGYGVLSVPYGQMSGLRIGDADEPDYLLTRSGDRFSGRVLDHDFTMLSVLRASRKLAFRELSEIFFSTYSLPQREWLPDAALETSDGDRFFARLGTDSITIETASGMQRVALAEVERLDLAVRMDGDEYLARIVLKDGHVVEGEPRTATVSARTRYGATLAIPLRQLTTLVSGSASHEGRPDFFNQPLASARIIRDRLPDGSPAPEVVVLEGGRYLRGAVDGDEDEKPPKPVSVAPFAIGVSEVTFEEYDRFCADTGRERPDDSEWGRGRRPVVNVSWLDAVAYTDWLSRVTRQRYRLPTDAEWEFAARAGTSTRFWWGDEVGVAHANCEGCGSIWDGDRTAPAGSFPPNPWGLHDTAGNVFEWVADCYNSTFADAPADGSAFDKPGCGKRVIRGGAWSFPPGEIRSTNRWRDFPSRHSDDTGFRVVRELEEGGH
ncbi:MAG TPA: formylglycine-generating enzyme family protein [Gammaproteobacteria bacterium]|nr:formylglycine-generating enzyme family protein [Gammaproteobacteria bacterium]